MSSKLTVIIVSYNTCDILRQCLESLSMALRAIPATVAVVDNASTDGTLEMIRCEFPWVTLYPQGTNLGFAGANNLAILDSESEYLLLLNPDTIVEPLSISTMLAFLEDRSQAGVVGCRLIHPVSGDLEFSGRAFPTATTLFCTLSYLDRVFPRSQLIGAYRMTYWDRREIRRVGWVTGACMLVRRNAIADVGLLDTRFFMYGEDLDWCYRFQQASWEVWYLPTAIIQHYGGRSAQNWPEALTTSIKATAITQHYDSLLLFARLHYAQAAQRRVHYAIAAAVTIRMVLWWLRELVAKRTPARRSQIYFAALRYLLSTSQ
jgi:GT2 family glycosyltransferase